MTASGRLLAVKSVHSAVFAVELGAILWLLGSGVLGRRDRSVAIAGAMVVGEAAVFIANRGVCPLTPLAEEYGAADGRVSDIFLPDVLARTIPYWSTALIATAAGLHARSWRMARRGRGTKATAGSGAPLG
jgi:hypothetical protein